MEYESHLKPGTLLHHNSYRIERVLGQGGFGITYLAKHTVLNKFVAIKEFFPKTFCYRETTTNTISTPSTANTALVERLKKKFIKEAEHIGKFDSPYIVKIIDVFEENQTAYYIMDYIEGMSLNDLVKAKGPLTESKAIEYVLKVGHALTYIHSENINHLDVKPANIMLRTKDDTPLLVDFGLSKQYDSEGHQTSTTPVGISHGFAPMEQYKEGGVREFSPQTDLYSLAATLYYLLTGIVPPQAILMIDEELSFPAGFPERLIQIIGRAMSTKRSDRQPTIEMFCRQLTGDASAGEETEIIDTFRSEAHEHKEVKDKIGKDKKKELKDTEHAPLHASDKKIWKNKTPIRIIGLCASLLSVIFIIVFVVKKNHTVDNSQPEPTPAPVADGIINDHHWVDLGLPSGLKWAMCNVGADYPYEKGDYFAWGEISPKTRYTSTNYLDPKVGVTTATGDTIRISTYYSDVNLDIDANNFDAAQANWGSTWRMPKQSEWNELINECTWTWTSSGDIKGYEVTGKNGNSIFLPAAGGRTNEDKNYVGECGYYWSDSHAEDFAGIKCSYQLFFDDIKHELQGGYRYQGGSVRPVSD